MLLFTICGKKTLANNGVLSNCYQYKLIVLILNIMKQFI